MKPILPHKLFAMCLMLCALMSTQVFAALNPQSAIDFTDGKKSKKLTLAQMTKSLTSEVIDVYDPVYKASHKYRAFKFEDVAKLAGFDVNQSYETTFLATDGYNAVMPRDMLKRYPNAYLAYQDLDAGDKVFFPVKEGKETVDPGPFYLMWQDPETYVQFPWPFAIKKVVFSHHADPYAKIMPVPGSNEDILVGFQLFKNKCIACHSINLIGGTIGPELNIPKNITEYRSDKFLKAWIKDPESFRARSRMTGVSDITDEQIDLVLDYLHYMKNHKIPVPAQ